MVESGVKLEMHDWWEKAYNLQMCWHFDTQ